MWFGQTSHKLIIKLISQPETAKWMEFKFCFYIKACVHMNDN